MRISSWWQRSALLRGIRSPSILIAAAALVFAMTGGAVAVDKINKDEVAIFTATGGPVASTTPSDWTSEFPPTAIPLTLNGASFTTFTQKAGESVIVAAKGDLVPASGTDACQAFVVVWVSGAEIEAELAFQDKTDAGPNIHSDSAVLAAPAADRVVSVTAGLGEAGTEGDSIGCDEEAGETASSDTYTATIRVTVTTLRN